MGIVIAALLALWLLRWRERPTDNTDRGADKPVEQLRDDATHAQPTSARVRRAAPPPSLRPESHYVASLDPESEKYDPGDLALGVAEPSAPWLAEKRSEPWATQRERAINDWIAQHLPRVAPNARVTELSCKQRTCKVAVATDHLNDIMGQYPIAMLAPTQSITTSSSGEVEFYLMYPPELLDESSFLEFVERSLKFHQTRGGANASGDP